jgi:hypothetical protein
LCCRETFGRNRLDCAAEKPSEGTGWIVLERDLRKEQAGLCWRETFGRNRLDCAGERPSEGTGWIVLQRDLRKEQTGFRHSRSCIDQISTLRVIIEQSLEFQSPL